MRQLQEKYHGKGKKLYYAFVDLEKAFDSVPHEVVKWALRKSGVDEWIVRAVMAMYTNAQTAVRTASGDNASFDVKVGLHQGPVLSHLIFVIVIDVITRKVGEGLPWELLYVDDIVHVSESEEKLKESAE
ncbi:hypothetical protein JGG67_22945, partial [Salmonella enterica subsp. enterica serovar Derby]|nr:hypothetical protein [Salmonella enterica subsp. enterica serovar Derby]